ncbi:MAG: hypothetical protein AAF485_07390, partial [Chloroflexota bacterium]
NGTGVVTHSFGKGPDTIPRIAIQPDNKVVLVVNENKDPFFLGSDFDMIIARYTITGTLDTTFNGTGIVTSNIAGSDFATGIALQPDGKIVVVGSISQNGNHSNLVARYTTTGTLDTSFNNTGVATTSVGSSAFNNPVIVQDDKIIIVGNSNSADDIILMRYQEDGLLDTTLNGTGWITTTLNTGCNYFGGAITEQPDKKLVVMGSSFCTAQDDHLAIIRYNDDGSLDTTFQNRGYLTNTVGNFTYGTSVLLQPDGKIVATGASINEHVWESFAVARFIGAPALLLSKTVNTATPQPNDLITYTLTINNPNAITITNALISDTLPLSLTLAGPVTLTPEQPNAILATSSLSLPVLAKGVIITSSRSITLTVPVTVGSDIPVGLWLTNTATVISGETTILAEDTALITVTSIISDPLASTYLPVIYKNTSSDLVPNK